MPIFMRLPMRVQRYHRLSIFIGFAGAAGDAASAGLIALLVFAQPKNNSAANPQIVRAVVETVGEFGHEKSECSIHTPYAPPWALRRLLDPSPNSVSLASDRRLV